MNSEFERMQKEIAMTYFETLFRHLAEGTAEKQDNFNQDTWYTDRDSNQAPPEYKSQSLPLESSLCTPVELQH
jgi:hypothetical protein